MSIRTVQTKLRASPSFNVLTVIDTNSPPGLSYRAQDIDLYFEKPSQPSYSSSSSAGSLAPSPVIHPGSFSRRSATSTSTLSPYASPYKPRSTPRSTSQFQIQNQYQQQTQRAGARAGRAAPALSSFDSELPGVSYSQTNLGGMSVGNGSLMIDPMFNGIPTYSLTSRFDPFGDYSASEKTSIPSSRDRPSLSPLTPNPTNSTALTQHPGAGTGSEPAYTHYYYYDKATNSPTLAYGSRQINNNRINFNHPRNQWNHKTTTTRGNNNNNNHYNNRRPNNSFSPSRSPSPPSPLPTPQVAFNSLPSAAPSRSPSPPSPTSFAPVPIAFPVVNAKADVAVENPFTDPVPPPVRTRKRSNAFREVPKLAQPMMPSSSPPLPEIKPKVSEKKNDRSMASKLVAAMLLNRVDASGRSRCAGSATKRLGLGGQYVKSGLSRVVCVEC